MLEIHLRFDGPDEAEAVLETLGIETFEGKLPCNGIAASGVIFALDVVFSTGSVRSETADMIMTAEGLVRAAEVQPGYHVNLLWRASAIPPELATYAISPATPALLWASA